MDQPENPKPKQGRGPLDPPSLKELLDCLVTCPDGTVGSQREQYAISVLYLLCRDHGFGNIAQIIKAIESIWLKDEDMDSWVAFYANQRKLMHELAGSHPTGEDLDASDRIS